MFGFSSDGTNTKPMFARASSSVRVFGAALTSCWGLARLRNSVRSNKRHLSFINLFILPTKVVVSHVLSCLKKFILLLQHWFLALSRTLFSLRITSDTYERVSPYHWWQSWVAWPAWMHVLEDCLSWTKDSMSHHSALLLACTGLWWALRV